MNPENKLLIISDNPDANGPNCCFRLSFIKFPVAVRSLTKESLNWTNWFLIILDPSNIFFCIKFDPAVILF